MTDYKSRHLVNAGYRFEFEAEPSALYCAYLDLRLTPEEFDVNEVYRFDGDASGEDEQVLYLISSLVGVKGTLILDLHDVFEENMSFEMAVKLRTHPYGGGFAVENYDNDRKIWAYKGIRKEQVKTVNDKKKLAASNQAFSWSR